MNEKIEKRTSNPPQPPSPQSSEYEYYYSSEEEDKKIEVEMERELKELRGEGVSRSDQEDEENGYESSDYGHYSSSEEEEEDEEMRQELEGLNQVPGEEEKEDIQTDKGIDRKHFSFLVDEVCSEMGIECKYGKNVVAELIKKGYTAPNFEDEHNMDYYMHRIRETGDFERAKREANRYNFYAWREFEYSKVWQHIMASVVYVFEQDRVAKEEKKNAKREKQQQQPRPKPKSPKPKPLERGKGKKGAVHVWKAFKSLHESQKPHVDRLVDILENKSNVAFDMSMMGLGKTVSAGNVAARLGYKSVIVIAPTQAVGHWRKHLAEMGFYHPDPSYARVEGKTLVGVEPEDSDRTMIIHYAGVKAPRQSPMFDIALKDAHRIIPIRWCPKVMNLRRHGPKKKPIKNGMNAGKQLEFHMKSDLRRTIEDEGILVIIDEAQNIKNTDTDTFEVVSSLAKAIGCSEGRSKMLLLSATLFDKEKTHWKSFAEIVEAANGTDLRRIIKDRVLTGKLDTILIENVIPALKSEIRVSEEEMDKKLEKMKERNVMQHMRVYELVEGGISKENMKLIETLLDRMDRRNMKMVVRPQHEDDRRCGKGGDSDSEAEEEEDDDEQYCIFKDLHELEKVKAPILAEQIARVMVSKGLEKPPRDDSSSSSSSPRRRRREWPYFFVVFNNLTAMERFRDKLVDDMAAAGASDIRDQIAMVHGATPVDIRNSIFDSYNNSEHPFRVLLATMKTVATAVNLDDRSPEGLYPRHTYIFPSFHYLDVQQVTGRTYRIHGGTSSPAAVFFAYVGGEQFSLEASIMTSSQTKGSTVASLHDTAKLPSMVGHQPFADEEERMLVRFRDAEKEKLPLAAMKLDDPKFKLARLRQQERVYIEVLLEALERERSVEGFLDSAAEIVDRAVRLGIPTRERLRNHLLSDDFTVLAKLLQRTGWEFLRMNSARPTYVKKFRVDRADMESPLHYLCDVRHRDGEDQWRELRDHLPAVLRRINNDVESFKDELEEKKQKRVKIAYNK